MGRIQNQPRGNEALRVTSFAAAIILFLHIAAFPIYFGFGSLFIFGLPDGMQTIGRVLVFTGLLSLALFCLSTQFYLASTRGR